jgi:hypothetical protein
MKSGNIHLKSEPNGAISIESDGALITIDANGDIHVSAEGPIQLTGACLAKLDQANVNAAQINEALGRRIAKRR